MLSDDDEDGSANDSEKTSKTWHDINLFLIIFPITNLLGWPHIITLLGEGRDSGWTVSVHCHPYDNCFCLSVAYAPLILGGALAISNYEKNGDVTEAILIFSGFAAITYIINLLVGLEVVEGNM